MTGYYFYKLPNWRKTYGDAKKIMNAAVSNLKNIKVSKMGSDVIDRLTKMLHMKKATY